jgi:hypothetical protein
MLQFGCEYLVALQSPCRIITLKGKLFTIKTPVCLSIVTPEGKLANIFKMFLILSGWQVFHVFINGTART